MKFLISFRNEIYKCLEELRNRNGFTEYNFHQTKFEFFKDVFKLITLNCVLIMIN